MFDWLLKKAQDRFMDFSIHDCFITKKGFYLCPGENNPDQCYVQYSYLKQFLKEF